MSDIETVPDLDDVERRVLAHLPPWRDEQEATLAAEHERDGHSEKERAALKKAKRESEIAQGTARHVESYTLAELTERLRRDEHLPLALAKRVIEQGSEPRPLDETLVASEMDGLARRDLASVTDGSYRMNAEGLAALTGTREHESIAQKNERLYAAYTQLEAS